jgi:hypothetical protein
LELDGAKKLVYVDFSLLGGNTNTVNRPTAQLDISKEAYNEVNVEESIRPYFVITRMHDKII